MESNCVFLKRQVEEMETMLQNAMSEKEELASQLVDTQDKLDGKTILLNDKLVVLKIKMRYCIIVALFLLLILSHFV